MLKARQRADVVIVTRPGEHPPAVRCLGCAFAWHSPLMADGLRLLGTCPKCDGELDFAASEPGFAAPEAPSEDLRAPHLVLGVPRR
jgi:hypothetical protein